MSERQTGTLFTVDWLGTPHLDTECEAFADEISLENPQERLLAFHERAFGWLECANLEKIDAEIEQLLQVHQPSTVAPAHGFVVRENVPEYTRQMKSVARTIRDQAEWVRG
jgi:flavorubredoxin